MADEQNFVPERLLREPEVAARTGLSRTLRWRLARIGRFPKSIPITDRIRGWRERDVESWIRSRIEAAGCADADAR